MFTTAYGIYLMHGGTPENFEKLTMDDVQIIFTTYMSLKTGTNTELLKGLSEILRGGE